MALSDRQGALAGIYIQGDKEILEKLLSFDSREFKTAVTFAARKAESIPLKDARSRAAGVGKKGNIAKSLIEKVKQYPSSGAVLAIVGADSKYRDAQTGHRPSKTLHLVERGTKPHEINAKGEFLLAVPIGGGQFRYVKSVHHPGTAAHPILTPAQEQNNPKVIASFSAEIGKKVERMWSKSHGLS